MKLRFVSHASMIVTTDDAVIWSDPWLFGKAFNDSWSLFPDAHFDNDWYNAINYIWISHEHPDHFHIPTLKSLPDEFKASVTILFQENNSNKLTDALKKQGYKNFIRLPHRKSLAITPKTTLWNYQVGHMDSILAICSKDKVLLNLNDAQINAYDARLILKKLGKVDILLNQFSLAGYNGHHHHNERLSSLAKSTLEKVYFSHTILKAKKTIPFASMIYFSTEDNHYINGYINTPNSVYDYFKTKEKGDEVIVMYPADEYILGNPYDNKLALDKYSHQYAEINSMPISQPEITPPEKLLSAFNRLHASINKRYYKFLISFFLKPIPIYVPDLNLTFIFDLAKGIFCPLDNNRDHDLIIYSQPLYFAMQFDWGFQTLSVSARHKVVSNYTNYQRHRILFALNNAEVWIKLSLLCNLHNLKWIIKRFNGLFRQIKYRMIRQVE